MRHIRNLVLALAGVVVLGAGGVGQVWANQTLMNVSYDPTREFYREYNVLFAAWWHKNGGPEVTIRQSHGGSGAQARAVIDGLKADVVTLALAADIDAIARLTGKIPANWQKLLPNRSAPYTSTIVFMVRKNNPKGIHDWGDLARAGVSVITPNPKTSGGARWNHLAAWAWANRAFDGDEGRMKEYMKALYRNVPVLDTGARGATTTFTRRNMGDVLVCWENEAFLVLNDMKTGDFEIVVPSMSILAEPSVAVVQGNTEKNITTGLARAYLAHLYSPEGQALAARHYYRPRHMENAAPQDAARFRPLKMVTIDDPLFGGWDRATKDHFADGALFDQLYAPDRHR